MQIDEYQIDALELGQRIRKARHECGMKQNEVCEKLDCSTTHLSHIENGRVLPTLQTLFWFCMEYHQTMDYFLMDSYKFKSEDFTDNKISPKLRQLKPEGLNVISNLTDSLLDYQKQYKKTDM